jgi:hypothetical protein
MLCGGRWQCSPIGLVWVGFRFPWLRVMTECEKLILVNGAELLQDGGRLVMTVRFMKVEDLRRTGQCEEKYAGTNEKTDI